MWPPFAFSCHDEGLDQSCAWRPEPTLPQIKLGMFYWQCGHHLAAWRHPRGVPDSGANLAHLIELAKLAEQGLFDMFFMADSVTWWRGSIEAMERDSYSTWIEPFTLMGALSQHTSHLGLVCTATTTYDQPYLIARHFASLDLISGGRAGRNLVTSGNPAEAESFGLDAHMEKTARYARGREFAHVVRGLWNSWSDGVFVRDKAACLYIDRTKLDVLDHRGEFFRVKGPLNVPPSPQGEPVLVQAGASEDGKELAAETAEVVFGAQTHIEPARAFYADVKGRMARYGRDPDSLKIMPGLFVCVGETKREAQRKYDELQDLIDPVVGLQLLSKRLEWDLTGCDVNGPLPELPHEKINSSRSKLMWDLAQREGYTIKDPYRHIAGARGHCQIIGTPKEIADMMEEWVATKACDGFNVMPPLFPDSLIEFNAMVIPELQRRGLFRRQYEGTTLRANLGLQRPAWSPQPPPTRTASKPR
jgi:FMN-dependent oxidoreductase (nitrilotriacetate monooxygenase family)